MNKKTKKGGIVKNPTSEELEIFRKTFKKKFIGSSKKDRRAMSRIQRKTRPKRRSRARDKQYFNNQGKNY